MIRPPSAELPWDRRATITLLALVLVCAASTVWLVHPWYETTPFTADGSLYILCSKSLLAGQGYSVLGMPFIIRPPGFSLLIAPLLASRGLDFHALNLFVSAFGVAAVALLFALARPRLGNAAAACIGLLLWTNPGFQRFANQVMSDVPGLAFVLGCFLVARWAGQGAARRDAILGLAIGLSAHVRTAAALLVPAEILARALAPALASDGPRSLTGFLRERVLVLATVPFAVLLPWSLRNAFGHPPWPAEQTLNASYLTLILHRDTGDPSSPRVPIAEILARVPERIPGMLRHLGSRLDPQAEGLLPTVLGAGVVAALVLAVVRRRSMPEISALALLGTLAFYPMSVESRLVLPVFAIGLLATAEAAVLVFERFLGPKSARGIVAVSLVGLAFADFAPRRGWEEIRAAHERDVALAAALEQHLASGDVLAAPVGLHLSIRLGRPVYSLSFVARREGFAGVERVIEERGVDTVIAPLVPARPPNLLPALEARYGRGERVRSHVVIRIRH
jgi:4-amino-4-deoxy-L-arabinose transferase-like glycosyltransferase